ncbi:MAG TPA: LysR family transcriptional regulator [Aliidongia sp.]|uniref:LysR family transcriptional regulator n=1 Tax=Aliidongia sp. TaxID=1914230 RepID=UPI002DDCEE11|nr:LysR family transcriptional regulator [Aliidongia sp.]HEV2676465.1 LysR family transcriptional regulator [Aliidongia sp.]
MDWNDLQYFLAVARDGSLTGAARRLHVSQSTVTRRIEALETALKAPLFLRRREGYVLSEAGAELLPCAERAEEALAVVTRQRFDSPAEIAGTVRVAVAEMLGQWVLLPALGELRTAHPDLEIELVAGIETIRLGRREADLAIRLQSPREAGGLTIRRLGALGIGLYASAGYLEARGIPVVLADLAGHDLVGWDPVHADFPIPRWMAEIAPAARQPIRVNTMAGHLLAARAGLGIAALLRPAAEETGLVRVLPDAAVFHHEIFLVAQALPQPDRRIEAVALFIDRLFRREMDRLTLPDLVTDR